MLNKDKAIDFMMERVNEVVTANKKLVLKVKEADKMTEYWHGVFDAEVQVNTNLKRDLKEYVDFHKALRGLMNTPIVE